MNRKIFVGLCCCCLYMLAGPVFFALAASDLQIDIPDRVAVGDAFICHFQGPRPKNIELVWDGKKIPLELHLKNGMYSAKCLLGVGLKTSPGKKSIVLYIDGQKQQRMLLVEKKNFAEQWLTVNPGKVSLNKKDLDRHYREKVRVRKILDTVSSECFWSLPFCRPVPGEVSSVFGLRRFFNKQPRSPHGGLDFRGKKGTPVKACADGVVALRDEHFFAGNCVYIDHGLGVVSMYFHLSAIDVRMGEFVRKGQVVGKIGSTGRVTGPHLHFGLSTQGTLVDPMPLLNDCN